MLGSFCDLVRIQTLNLHSRNVVLYSVELRSQYFLLLYLTPESFIWCFRRGGLSYEANFGCKVNPFFGFCNEKVNLFDLCSDSTFMQRSAHRSQHIVIASLDLAFAVVVND